VNTDKYSPLPRGQGFSSRFAQALFEEAVHSSTLSSGNYIRDNPTSGLCQACYATSAYAQEIAQRGDPFANAANYVFALGLGVAR
jgi:hypothetical protein